MNPDTDIHEAAILIVDDDPDQIIVIERALERTGFADLTSTNDPRDALEMLEGQTFDLAILDLKMPGVDGVQVATRLRKTRPAQETAILVVSAIDNDKVVAHLMRQGVADDYVKKPFGPEEFAARVERLLAPCPPPGVGQDDARETGQGESAAVEESLHHTIEALAVGIGRAVGYREYGGNGLHALRVAAVARALALASGWEADAADELRLAALLHGVGRLAVPEGLLLRRENWDAEERSLFYRQTALGSSWLSSAVGSPQPALIQRAIAAADDCDEHWDGSGHPKGEEGEGISAEARILAVASVVDSLMVEGTTEVAARLEDFAGRRLDPNVVATARDHLPDLIGAWERVSRGE